MREWYEPHTKETIRKVMSEIGGRLADARKNKGKTIDYIASKLGVSPNTVTSWESGHCGLKIATLFQYGAVLELDDEDELYILTGRWYVWDY